MDHGRADPHSVPLPEVLEMAANLRECMGIEPTQENTSKPRFPAPRGTESGTLANADPLDALAATLRTLSPADRARLAAMLAQGQG